MPTSAGLSSMTCNRHQPDEKPNNVCNISKRTVFKLAQPLLDATIGLPTLPGQTLRAGPADTVSHRPDQLADFFASVLIAQIDLLVEESGGMRHQHLRVGYDDRPGATEHPAQGRLRVRRIGSPQHGHRLVAQDAAARWP